MKITFNNNDTHNLNRKPIKTSLLIFGGVMTAFALTQIVCLLFKPVGYEKIVSALGNKYIMQLLFGVFAFWCYYLIKNSKPVNSN